MNKELLKQSISIFDTQDKWDALFEIHNQSQDIIKHWLSIGAVALRKNFAGDTKSDWVCQKWGNDEWDTRWYLKKYGEESLGIGFGWIEVELHLHQTGPQYDWAAKLLSSSEFKTLLELFELKTPPTHVSDGGLAYNNTVNPFSGVEDIQVRQRELAWLAAHETKDYVEKMGGIIRRLTNDPIHTGLFSELNRQILKETSAVQVAQP